MKFLKWASNSIPGEQNFSQVLYVSHSNQWRCIDCAFIWTHKTFFSKRRK